MAYCLREMGVIELVGKRSRELAYQGKAGIKKVAAGHMDRSNFFYFPSASIASGMVSS